MSRSTDTQQADTQQADVGVLPRHLVPRATALWHQAGLTRPWNDPDADCLRALDGAESTVLCLRPVGAEDRDVGRDVGRDVDSHEELLGTVMVGHDGHRGWVYYLAVPAARRGQGLGERLVRAAESWLRQRGVPKLMLMVRQENAAVRAFYDRLGYSEQDVVTLGRFL
ncbi:GNAT family acetyltransferase [Nesterenkonia suensis]